jgi:ABC-2 type transport system permease protein
MRAVFVVLRSAVADAAARRSAFWSQVVVMMVNDLAWVGFWLIFFHRVPSLRSWDSGSVLLLFAVLTTSAGFVLGVLSNCRRLPDLVRDGALDEALTLPVPTLRHLLVSRVDPVNFGDVIFGVVLFTVAGGPTPTRIAVYLAASAVSIVLLTSFLLLIGSTVFVTGRGEGPGLGMHAVLLLASYPADIFGGTTKLLLYTVVPAAFVAAVPARLIEAPTVSDAVWFGGAALVFAVAARVCFALGLRRYSSGSAWTTRG